MEITKIDIHHYALRPQQALNRLATTAPRQGALLRVWFSDCHNPGHADLFPWPELGDPPLAQQLASLKADTPFSLAAASVMWAHEDAHATDREQSLLDGTDLPSHVTLIDRTQVGPQVKLAKLKITAHDVSHWDELEKLLLRHPQGRWRFDFNGLFNDLNAARSFWGNVSAELKSVIDFLEDPVTDELLLSADVRAAFPGARIAVDHCSSALAWSNADVRVLKPVTYAPEVLVNEASEFPGEVVVTSMMDHPLGQLIALCGGQRIAAAIGQRLLPGGLLTHELYEPHAASSWVKREQDFLRPVFTGSGWGLRAQLDSLTWESLR